MLITLSLRNSHFFKALLGIGIFLCVVILTWSIPPTFAQDALPRNIDPATSIIRVGNTISAPVVVDGYELFRVAMQIPIEEIQPGKHLSIVQRAKLIKNEIYAILDNQLYGGQFSKGFNPDTLTIRVKTDNQGNTQIFVSDNNQLQERAILTVTPEDAQYNGYSIEIWTNKLTKIIKQALIRGYEERQPTYLYKAGLWSLGVILVSALLSFGVYLLQKQLSAKTKKLNHQKFELSLERDSINNNQTSLDSSEKIYKVTNQLYRWKQKYNTNEFQQLILKLTQVLIWSFAIWRIAHFFPHTRLLSKWMSREPLFILTIVIIIGVAIRMTTLIIDYFLKSFQEQQTNSNNSYSPYHRRELRFSTYSAVLKGISKAIWCALAFMIILDSLEIPIAPIVAGLGIIGLALSLGSQNLIRDVVNGIFILLEDQYAVGDYISIGETAGYVENMNLRITQIRGKEGRLTTLPNGSISIVHNQTKDWSRVDFKTTITYQSDIDFALDTMQKVIEKMAKEPDWKSGILTPVLLIGVSDLTETSVELEMRIKTRAGMQWAIAREFRRRLKFAFEQQGIQFGRDEQAIFLPDVAEWLSHNYLNKE